MLRFSDSTPEQKAKRRSVRIITGLRGFFTHNYPRRAKKIKYCIPSKNKTIKGKERKQIIKFPSTGKIKENWFKCKGKKFSHWKTKKKKYTPGTKIVIENEKTLTLYPVFVKKEKKKAKKKSSKKKK